MRGKTFNNIEDAILQTSYRSGREPKNIYSDMDMGRTEFQQKATTQGRFFNPRQLIHLQSLTKEYSILYTMCDMLGFDRPNPKTKDLNKMLGPLFEHLPEIEGAIHAIKKAAEEQGK